MRVGFFLIQIRYFENLNKGKSLYMVCALDDNGK